MSHKLRILRHDRGEAPPARHPSVGTGVRHAPADEHVVRHGSAPTRLRAEDAFARDLDHLYRRELAEILTTAVGLVFEAERLTRQVALEPRRYRHAVKRIQWAEQALAQLDDELFQWT